MTKFPKYKYKGYVYVPHEEIDYGGEGLESKKIFHYVKPPKEDTSDPKSPHIEFDWSAYSIPTFEQFKLWINLGCPDRITGGPLDAEDLQKIEEVSF